MQIDKSMMREDGDVFSCSDGRGDLEVWRAEVIYDNPVIGDNELMSFAVKYGKLNELLEVSSNDKCRQDVLLSLVKEHGAEYVVTRVLPHYYSHYISSACDVEATINLFGEISYD